MFSEFLAQDTTYKTQLRDFSEWHKGVENFGFWAIEVLQVACRDKVKIYQEHLCDKLHTHYFRQPHITLSTFGLLHDKQLNDEVIMKQIKQIKKSNIKPFSLKLSSCNSFYVCPYLSITDSLGNLNSLRECLSDTSQENTPSNYIPHVTLGFYNESYKTSEILKDITKLDSKDIEFRVSEIIFAQYKTKDIQGAYQVLHRIELA